MIERMHPIRNPGGGSTVMRLISASLVIVLALQVCNRSFVRRALFFTWPSQTLAPNSVHQAGSHMYMRSSESIMLQRASDTIIFFRFGCDNRTKSSRAPGLGYCPSCELEKIRKPFTFLRGPPTLFVEWKNLLKVFRQ
jgi:hypothetical protein